MVGVIMKSKVDLVKFVDLKRKSLESNGENAHKLIGELEVCSQSIHHWIEYCRYHYSNLENSTKKSDLRMDRISSFYRKAGDISGLRYIYEANIIAFLNSLHALLDCFPHLLDLFINSTCDLTKNSDGWKLDHIKKYKRMSFYDELIDFMLDDTFNKVKGYVNTTKHKHLILILNKKTHLEFDNYNYNELSIRANGKVACNKKIMGSQNIMVFIQECYDKLIPKFFRLCNSVQDYKS